MGSLRSGAFTSFSYNIEVNTIGVKFKQGGQAVDSWFMGLCSYDVISGHKKIVTQDVLLVKSNQKVSHITLIHPTNILLAEQRVVPYKPHLKMSD